MDTCWVSVLSCPALAPSPNLTYVHTLLRARRHCPALFSTKYPKSRSTALAGTCTAARWGSERRQRHGQRTDRALPLHRRRRALPRPIMGAGIANSGPGNAKSTPNLYARRLLIGQLDSIAGAPSPTGNPGRWLHGACGFMPGEESPSCYRNTPPRAGGGEGGLAVGCHAYGPEAASPPAFGRA